METDSQIASQIERLRKKAHPLLTAGWTAIGLCIAAGLILLIGKESALWRADEIMPFILVTAGLGMAGGALVFIGGKFHKKLKAYVSENIIRVLLSEVFELKEYVPLSHISGKIIGETELIGGWTHCSGSDFCEGKYKGINIIFSDIRLTSTGKDDKTHTHFKGLWLICDFRKELPAKLRIRENNTEQRKNGLETENIIFNEKFQILTDDPHTAFYVLTPHFMEKILKTDAKACGRIYLCFTGGKVHIAVHNGHDFFEHGTGAAEFRNLDSLRARFRSEIGCLTGLADELLLNDSITGDEKNVS